MPPLVDIVTAPRAATPIPDPCGRSFLRPVHPSLRLMVASDGPLRIRHLVQKHRATGLLRPHLPDDPGFITPGMLRLLAKMAPQLLHADDECLLWQCVKHGQVECVRYLLALGADPNAAMKIYQYYDPETDRFYEKEFIKRYDESEDVDGFPLLNLHAPLATAVRFGRVDCMQLLLDHGADLARDPLGFLTLEAARKQNWAVLYLLLSRGAEASLQISGLSTVAELIIEADSNGADLFHTFRLLVEWGNCPDLEGALELSALHGNLPFVKYLVDHVGISVPEPHVKVTDLSVLSFLVQRGFAYPADLRDLMDNPATRTAGHVRLAVQCGADANDGRVLRDCARYGSIDIMRFLVNEARADIYKHFRDTFRVALQHAQPLIINFLLERCQLALSKLIKINEEISLTLTSEQQLKNDVYIGLDESGNVFIRIRAGLNCLRVTDTDFLNTCNLIDNRVGKMMRIIQATRPGKRVLQWWLEDTLVKHERVSKFY